MQLGTPFGFLLSTAAIAAVTLLPESALLTWGWRIPFLLSAILMVIGLYVRLHVVESPIFVEASAKRKDRRSPALEVLRRPKQLVLAVAAGLAPFALTSLTSTHVVAYASGIGYAVSDVMGALLAVVAISIVFIPLFSTLSDRLGRRRVMISGAIGTVLFAFPLYAMINTKSMLVMVGALMFAQLLQNAMYAPLTPLLSEMFATPVRYTGVSMAYQTAALLGAGFTPLIASGLVAATGSSVPLSLIAATTALASIGALALTPETNGRDLNQNLVP
jgi:MFS family permease